MTKSPIKKTIYVDVDEEITGIIDKLRSSNESIVALVLPKRATVFHSVVNMKLLKRSADQNDKKVVLITSENGVLPIAGSVGIHVASNLNSKPYLPTTPSFTQTDLPSPGQEEPEIDPTTSIGEAMSSGGSATKTKTKTNTKSETIEIDNRPKTEGEFAVEAASAAVADKKAKKGSKLKVPDFKKFRTLMIAGGVLLVALLIFAYWALAIAPKAVITLKGETSDAALSFDITADTVAQTLDEDKSIVPAKQKEIKKTDTEKVASTGQRDKGNKASGTMTLRNCSDAPVVIPGGTGVSSGDLTFITQAPISLDEGDFTSSGNCKSSSPTKDVAVVAQQGGDKYNVSSRSYAVSGFKGIIANGSSMSGGTTQIVKVVSATDVEQAKAKLGAKQGAVNEELKNTFKAEGYIGLSETFEAGTPVFTPTPAVDTEAPEVSVSAVTTYTMLGIRQDDVKKLVEKEAGKEIDTGKQSILSTGLSDATFQIGAKKGTKLDVGVRTKIVAGPEINQDELSKEIAGKKRGEAEQILAARPGLKEVQVDLKPFFNSHVPKKTSKITYVIQQADGSTIE